MEIELNGVEVWNRATPADGARLNVSTISPLSANDCILASAVNSFVESGADFSATDFKVLQEEIAPSAANYNRLFSEVNNNYESWNSTYGTVSNNSSNWNELYTRVDASASMWNNAANNAQSGYAASAWLANNSLDKELNTQAIMFAPEDEQINETENCGFLIDAGHPSLNNEKDTTQEIKANDYSTVILASPNNSPLRMGESNIIVDYCSANPRQNGITNSLVRQWATHESGTYNTVFFGGHRGKDGTLGTSDLNYSIINSYNNAAGITDSCIIGPNNKYITDSVSTTYGQEVYGCGSSILSWKGSNVYNSIAIKGSLWKKYDTEQCHAYLQKGPLSTETISARYSYDDYSILHSYYRHIKGLADDDGHNLNTYYTFPVVYSSIIMSTSGVNRELGNGASANYSIAVLNDYKILSNSKINSSLINASNTHFVSDIEVENTLLLTDGMCVNTDTKNTLALNKKNPNAGETFGSTIYNESANNLLDLGGRKQVKNSKYLLLAGANDCQINSANCSLVIGGSYLLNHKPNKNLLISSAADNSCSNSLCVCSNFSDDSDSMRNLVVGGSFGVQKTTDNLILYSAPGSYINDSIQNIILADAYGFGIEHCSGSMITNEFTNVYSTKNSIVNDYRVLLDNKFTNSILLGNTENTVYDWFANESKNSIYVLDNDNGARFYFNSQAQATNSYLNINNSTTSLECSAAMNNVFTIGDLPRFESEYTTATTFIPSARNIVSLGFENTMRSNSQNDTLARQQNKLILGNGNLTENISNSIICGSNNTTKMRRTKHALADNVYSFAGPMIVGSNNEIVDDCEVYPWLQNGTSTIVIGDNFTRPVSTTKHLGMGGIHIGANMDYTTDTKFAALLTKINCTLDSIFGNNGTGELKPMILSKSDGAYFVCFKGLRASDGANITQMYFRRKSDDAWCDVISRTVLQ